MKNVEIAEGGIGRRLSGTKFVLTDKPNSDQMEVWVDEDDRKLTRLYATSNGTYYPEDYDAYGFSSVTVSIHGGVALPEMPKIEMPDGIEYPALIPEIEMPDGTLKPIDELFPEIAEDPLTDIGEVKMPDTVGEEGSAITGIDPEDGYTYMASVDENGNLEVEKVPTGIQVTKGPDNTEYTFGDEIDYDGMEVSLVDKDGNVVKTKEYPTGKVPTDDPSLTKPDKTEDKETAKAKGVWHVNTDLVGFDPMFIGGAHVEERWAVVLIGYYRKYMDYNFGGLALVEQVSNGRMTIYVISSSQGDVTVSSSSVTYKESKDPITGEVILEELDSSSGSSSVKANSSYTHEGKTVYYGYRDWRMSDVYLMVPTVEKQSIGNVGRAAWEALYGSLYVEQDIPIEWNSIYSGEVYEDGTTVITSDPYES